MPTAYLFTAIRGKPMNFYQRAFRYVQRKKSKSILLFLCFLLISTLILCAAMILQTAQATSDSIQEKTGSKVILENQQGQNKISAETVSQLLDLASVTKVNRVASNTAFPTNFSPIIVKDGNDPLNLSVTLHAYDDTAIDGLFTQEKYRLLEGQHISENQNGIIINSILAELNQLSIGEQLTFVTESGGTASGKIIGIFFSGMERRQDDLIAAAYRIENQIFVDQELFEKMYGANGYSSLSVYTANPDSLDELYEDIESIVDDSISIATADTLYQQMQAPLKQVIRIASLMLALIVITAVVIISLLLCMWMRTRTKEMAVLISLGLSKWNLFLQAITESISLFICSIFGAASISGLFSKIFIPIIFSSSDYASMADTHLEPEHLIPLLLLGSMIVLVAVCCSIVPILRANPRDTLSRMEG